MELVIIPLLCAEVEMRPIAAVILTYFSLTACSHEKGFELNQVNLGETFDDDHNLQEWSIENNPDTLVDQVLLEELESRGGLSLQQQVVTLAAVMLVVGGCFSLNVSDAPLCFQLVKGRPAKTEEIEAFLKSRWFKNLNQRAKTDFYRGAMRTFGNIELRWLNWIQDDSNWFKKLPLIEHLAHKKVFLLGKLAFARQNDAVVGLIRRRNGINTILVDAEAMVTRLESYKNLTEQRLASSAVIIEGGHAHIDLNAKFVRDKKLFDRLEKQLQFYTQRIKELKQLDAEVQSIVSKSAQVASQ